MSSGRACRSPEVNGTPTLIIRPGLRNPRSARHQLFGLGVSVSSTNEVQRLAVLLGKARQLGRAVREILDRAQLFGSRGGDGLGFLTRGLGSRPRLTHCLRDLCSEVGTLACDFGDLY